MLFGHNIIMPQKRLHSYPFLDKFVVFFSVFAAPFSQGTIPFFLLFATLKCIFHIEKQATTRYNKYKEGKYWKCQRGHCIKEA